MLKKYKGEAYITLHWQIGTYAPIEADNKEEAERRMKSNIFYQLARLPDCTHIDTTDIKINAIELVKSE